MLEEKAREYYKKGYNCAESMIRAGNDVYGLHLHDQDMKMIAGFGGGLQCGDVCGALTGAICIISSKYVETKAHDSSILRPLTLQLVQAFQKEMGSRLCMQIKPKFYDKELHCENTVGTAAGVLEKVIQNWEEEVHHAEISKK